MSQARDDFEGFLKAHMSEEEKVIVHLETSLSHSLTDTLALISLRYHSTHSLYYSG